MTIAGLVGVKGQGLIFCLIVIQFFKNEENKLPLPFFYKNRMSQCPLCNNLNTSPVKHKKIKNLWFCSQCLLFFVWPQPSDSELINIYNVRYFKNQGLSNIGYEDYQKDKEIILKTFNRRFKTIEKIIPKPGRVLDLGCATGFFLEILKNKGWDVYGIDISEFAVKAAREKFRGKILNNVIENSNFPENYFNLITMWDYLEHVTNPKRAIAICKKILKPKGFLILTTPDLSSLIAKMTGERWMGYKDKEHLFYFSKQALKDLLLQQGFIIRKMQYVGKYISVDLFIKRLHLYSPLLSRVISKLIKIFNLSKWSEKHSIYINPFDIVEIIAQK